MKNKVALVVFALAMLPLQAAAADAGGVVRLDARVSTLGGGFEIGTALTPNYTVRVGINQFKVSADENSGDLALKGDLKLSSVSGLVDWRPWAGVAHLTAGVMLNNNKLEMTGTTQAKTYTFDGKDYKSNGGDTVTTSIGFNKVSPYLGIGWSGHPKKQGFSFSTDFGVLFQGSPKASVTTTGTWGGADTTKLKTDAENQMNTDMKSYKMYPVISIGVGYTF